MLHSSKFKNFNLVFVTSNHVKIVCINCILYDWNKNENDYFQNLFQVRGFPTVYVFSVSKRDDGKISITTETSGPYSCRMGYMASATEFINKANENIERLDIIEKALEKN